MCNCGNWCTCGSFANWAKRQSVPSVPGPNGNSGSVLATTKPSNALYKYDFVVNNWTNDERCAIITFLSTYCTKAVFGEEVGDEGTPHLQGYLSLKKKERITGLHKHPGLERASFRPVRNEKALIEYCRKGENVWEHGFPKPIKIITTLYPWQKAIEDIFLGEVDERKIYWYWEGPGGVGKSAFVKYMVIKHGCCFCDGGKKSDLINLVFNQDMDKCRAIIWDLPRSSHGSISYATLEAVKNGLICNTKYETGYKAFNPPHIFVFANFPPDSPEEMSEDRWVITELADAAPNGAA